MGSGGKYAPPPQQEPAAVEAPVTKELGQDKAISRVVANERLEENSTPSLLDNEKKYDQANARNLLE